LGCIFSVIAEEHDESAVGRPAGREFDAGCGREASWTAYTDRSCVDTVIKPAIGIGYIGHVASVRR
jgi:hypothetical protein